MLTRLLASLLLCAVTVQAGEIKFTANLPYKSGADLTEYEQTRCRLDIYQPVDAKDAPCLIWFHGGGLTTGEKDTDGTAAACRGLAKDGFLVASANYRLSPKVQYPAYIEDAAAAAAWLRAHAREYGGDSRRVFVGGHSAGAYLTAMLGLDATAWQKVGLKPADFAGFIPVSSQMTTHFTIHAERGLPKFQVIVDAAAPLNHVTSVTPPFLAFYAANDMQFRREENQLFYQAFVVAGNRRLTMREIADRDHGTIAGKISQPNDPVRQAIGDFLRQTPPVQ